MTADKATNGGGPAEETVLPSRFEARWHLVGAGLSNVWQFGDLELPAPTGRLLLRGQNGAGKTTALEALAPYLLDLNPAKMAAGKSRTTNLTSLMREGAPGKRRNGYAWLTLADSQEGLWSFGARLQYSDGASPPVKVTAFVVPGRPLHELQLHGPSLASLSSEQFAERVAACGGEILDEDGYVAYLAVRVFGGADAEEIGTLASRLRQVRNPALLGDISPEAAAEALRESLPGVDEGVIAATAEALAESDQTRQAFNRDSEAAELLEDFQQTWRAHVTEVVANAHKAAGDAERDRRNQIAHVTECERTLERESVNAVAARNAAEEVEKHISATRAEIEAIEKHDDYKQAGRLNDLKRTAWAQGQAAASALESMRGSAERSFGESESLRQTLQGIAEDLEELQREAAAADSEAGDSGTLLSWTTRERAALRVGEFTIKCGPELQIHGSSHSLRSVADSWLRTAEKRRQQSEEAQLAIVDYREVALLRAEANTKEEAATRAASTAEAERAKAAAAAADARDAARVLLDGMRVWTKDHRRLVETIAASRDETRSDPESKWTVDDVEEIADAESVLVVQTCDAIAHRVAADAEAIAVDLRSTAARAIEASRKHRQDARDLRNEADALRAGRLLPLPRPDWAGPGNDDVALGAVLEWQHGFDDPALRSLIEAALSASGLLGASVGTDGANTRYWRVESNGAAYAENLEALLSVDLSHPLATQAAEVLKRVRLVASVTEPRNQAADALCIGRDGTFCAGVLHGRVPGADDAALLAPAMHVGARQRRAAALARARALDEEADALEAQALQNETTASKLESDASRIIESARSAPSREDLRSKESRRAALARNADDAHDVAIHAESASKQARREFESAEREWLERTRGRGLPGDLEQLDSLRISTGQASAALRRAAGPVNGKLAERLERALNGYSSESTTHRLQEAESFARVAFQAAADAQTQVKVLEQTAGAAIAEIQTRHADAKGRISRLLAQEGPAKQAWVDASKDQASAQQSLNEAQRHLREEVEPRARQQLSVLRALLNVQGVTESVVEGEPVSDDEHLLEQVGARVQGRRTLTVRTVLEKADDARAKLAGIWSLDPGENHGELLTFVLRYRDDVYTPTDAAAYAQRLKARAEAALAGSEERALREFVIGRLPNAIGTAWIRLHDWVAQVNKKMQSAAASSGVGVQVRIPLRDDLPPACREVYELSCKISSVERTAEQQQQLGRALRALIEAASEVETMADRVAHAVDIREWVEVHYEVTRPGGTKHRWGRRTGLSSGERRLVVLAPMLAAIAAAYDRLGSRVLRIVMLDEVPAEVDEHGREGLARYIAALDLDLICTSYLWDGAPGAWDGIDAYDLEAAEDGTVVGFPMLMRGMSPPDPRSDGPTPPEA